MAETGQANDQAAARWAASVEQIAVVGAGTMGEGIAQGFAEAGIRVRLIDIDAGPIDRCLRQIEDNLRLAAAHGGAADPQHILDRIEPAVAPDPSDMVEACQLVVETVPEIADLKRALFAKFDRLPPDILLASNTSSMTMSMICAGMTTGHRALGVHYFNPAHLIPAVELHKGRDTDDATIAKVRALIERCGKIPFLVAKEIPGLVINRLTAALMREIGFLLDEGVITASELDAGVKASLGFRMAWVGPMEGSDFTGLDTGARVQTALLPTLSNRTGPFQALLDHVEKGELGVKTGRGWYEYDQGARETLLNRRNIHLLRQLHLFNEVSGS